MDSSQTRQSYSQISRAEVSYTDFFHSDERADQYLNSITTYRIVLR